MAKKQAEEELDTARVAIESALRSVSLVVVNEVDGTKDYKPIYVSMLKDCMDLLLQARKKIRYEL